MDIRFNGAGARFAGRQVLEPLSLTLGERRIGIIGLNGSGKTTFARMINGQVPPTPGSVSVGGLDTVKDGRQVLGRVGFIFQNPQNQIILPIVKDDIAFGLKHRGLSKAETAAATEAVLARLGSAHLAERRAHELSGGELQLAALAAVLVTGPDWLILDEPTNQLDLKNRKRVAETIAALDQRLIVISHDLALVEDFERVLLFHEGRLAADDTPGKAIAHYREIAGA